MKRSPSYIAICVALLAAGCFTPRSNNPIASDVTTSSEVGRVVVRVHWPAVRATQAIPYLTETLALTVKDAEDHTLLQQTLDRSKNMISLPLPPGTNYQVTVQAETATETRIALGSSKRFDIQRNRTTLVEDIELLPVITRFTGPSDAFAADADMRVSALNKPFALAFDGTDLLVADTSNNAVKRLTPSGEMSTIATLTLPQGIFSDAAGNIWIYASKHIHLIPKRDDLFYGEPRKTGQLYDILAGAGSINPSLAVVGFSMAQDLDGRILLSSQRDGKIYRLSAFSDATASLEPIIGTGSTIPTVTGIASSDVSLEGPTGLAVDTLGNLAIVDTGNTGLSRVVLLCRKDGNYFGKDMQAGNAYVIYEVPTSTLAYAYRLAFDPHGNLYFVSNRDHTVRKIDRGSGNGTLSIIAGQQGAPTTDASDEGLGNNGPAASASFYAPTALAITPDHRLFICDSQNNQIRLLHL